MKRRSLFGRLTEFLKDKIGFVAWKLFLWSIQRTEEQFWNDIYEQEKAHKNNIGADL